MRKEPETKPSDQCHQKKGDQPAKPRLTTPDLEFDYDRSQLRDPRPTPGRKARPRWIEWDSTQEIKDWVESAFEIAKPAKPPGRLNTMQKDRLFMETSLLNPFTMFHAKYRCHEQGRDGSPTYDEAGFELDWAKVNETTGIQ